MSIQTVLLLFMGSIDIIWVLYLDP